MSEWNLSDGPSRRWEKGKKQKQAYPRRARRKAGKANRPLAPNAAAAWGSTRRNVKYDKDIDATLGYPGDGPRPKARTHSHRRKGRSRLQIRPTAKLAFGRVPGKRMTPERIRARMGLPLRDTVFAPQN